MSAIRGLQAASTDPLANPIKNEETSKVTNPPAYIVITKPIMWDANAIIISFLAPNTL